MAMIVVDSMLCMQSTVVVQSMLVVQSTVDVQQVLLECRFAGVAQKADLQLLEGMLCIDPLRRWSAQRCLQHCYQHQ